MLQVSDCSDAVFHRCDETVRWQLEASHSADVSLSLVLGDYFKLGVTNCSAFLERSHRRLQK